MGTAPSSCRPGSGRRAARRRGRSRCRRRPCNRFGPTSRSSRWSASSRPRGRLRVQRRAAGVQVSWQEQTAGRMDSSQIPPLVAAQSVSIAHSRQLNGLRPHSTRMFALTARVSGAGQLSMQGGMQLAVPAESSHRLPWRRSLLRHATRGSRARPTRSPRPSCRRSVSCQTPGSHRCRSGRPRCPPSRAQKPPVAAQSVPACHFRQPPTIAHVSTTSPLHWVSASAAHSLAHVTQMAAPLLASQTSPFAAQSVVSTQ